MKYKNYLLKTLLLLFIQHQEYKGQLQTTDVKNFWIAYDSLRNCQTTNDSIDCINKYYIQNGTTVLKKFLKARNLSAVSYVGVIRLAPQFWKSVRLKTEKIYDLKEEIQSLSDQYSTILPNFKRPKITFIIGCLNSGGTVNKKDVIIGSEIACGDKEIYTHELNQSLRKTFSRDFAVLDYVAHEIVHSQQKGIPFFEFFKLIKYNKLSLENMCVLEGSCDFITKHFFGLNINESVHEYAKNNTANLIEQFIEDAKLHPFDYTNWLYNSGNNKIGQADLGYYIGFLATKSYYSKSKHKKKALKKILKRNKYKAVIKCLK